jgi:formyltetrahydrofolate-dependent phosphoribosylglycinamide formyltransferase
VNSRALPTPIGVLASGGGSNLQALLDYFAPPDRASVASVVWVGSNRADALALVRARGAGADTFFVAAPDDGDALLRELTRARVELLVLAGYLRLVPPAVVRAYHGRLLNVHPALLPAFGGPGMYGRHVHAAVLAAGCRVSGATVHFVDDAFDRGAIAAQAAVPVHSTDTPESLAARVMHAEHALLPRVVEALARGVVSLAADGRVVGDVAAPPT